MDKKESFEVYLISFLNYDVLDSKYETIIFFKKLRKETWNATTDLTWKQWLKIVLFNEAWE